MFDFAFVREKTPPSMKNKQKREAPNPTRNPLQKQKQKKKKKNSKEIKKTPQSSASKQRMQRLFWLFLFVPLHSIPTMDFVQ
jgi:hypothetical protein